MSMRISGLSPINPAPARKPEAARDRPVAAGPALPPPGPPPAPEPGREALDTAAVGAAQGVLPGQPAPAAEGQPSPMAEQSLQSVEDVRRGLLEMPAQAARAHANLVPATVLNLLA